MFCSPFYQCVHMSDFNEHCCDAWPCCMVGTMLALRYNMRKKENIMVRRDDDPAAIYEKGVIVAHVY